MNARTTSGVTAIQDWAVGYVERHPLASLATVGEQFVLGVTNPAVLASSIWSPADFQSQEFVRQGAFMAGTAVVPTVLVSLPVGVTLSIQFALLAGQVGATSLAGAASGLAVIRQAASLVAAMLMAAAVGSAITADLGSRTMREEIDAMEVMGVSVIRRLVVPRFAAAIMIGVAAHRCGVLRRGSWRVTCSTCISRTARLAASWRPSPRSPRRATWCWRCSRP